MQVLLLAVVFTVSQIWTLIAQEKCGLVPAKVFLAKGEKRQLVFWTDQDYSGTTTTQASSQTGDSEDPFLEFVNSNKQQNEEIQTTTTRAPEMEFSTDRDSLGDAMIATTVEQEEHSLDVTTEVSVGETTTEFVDRTTMKQLPQQTEFSQIANEDMMEEMSKETEETEVTTEIVEDLQEITELQEMTTESFEEMPIVTEANEVTSVVTEETEETEFTSELAETTLVPVNDMFDHETTTARVEDENDGSGAGETSITKIVFPNPTLDYEFEETSIGVTESMINKVKEGNSKIVFEEPTIGPVADDLELTMDVEASGSDDYKTFADISGNNVIYDDDIESYDINNSTDYPDEDEEDKILVVTSMPLNKLSSEEGNNSEDVLVVTGAPAQVKTWEELDLIEDDNEISTVLDEDFTTEITEVTTEMMNNKVSSTTVVTTKMEDEMETLMTTSSSTAPFNDPTMAPEVTTGKETTTFKEGATTDRPNKVEDTTTLAVEETTTLLEEVQDDDVYDYNAENEITESPATRKVFDDNPQEFPLLAVESETEKIFDETTIESVILQSVTLQSVILPIAAVESETEKISETITIQPVKTSSSYFPIAAIESEREETIFDETTTGSSIKTDVMPEVQAVEAEEEEEEDTEDTEDTDDFDYAAAAGSLETQAVFAETTTGAGFDTRNVQLKEETTVAAFTPAFTTAPIKNKTDDMILGDSSKIFFPDDIESMIAELASKMEEETTQMNLETTTGLSTEDLARDLANNTDSPIVEVEAGNVNGALALDNVVYYDDPDLVADDNILEQNVDSRENEIVDDFYDTTGSVTTVINGFIINKKSVIAQDNNGLETVRTSGLVDLNFDDSMATEDFRSVEMTTEIPEEPVTMLDDMIMNETDSTNTTEYEYSDDMFNFNTTEDYQETVVKSSNEISKIIVENPGESEANSETKERPATFPVTELLNGIYKLIQGYIPTQAEKQSNQKPVPASQNVEKKGLIPPPTSPKLVYFDSPENKPLPNVHNAARIPPVETSDRRDQVEAEVEGLVPSPFKQLSAPDLSGLVPAEDREDNVQYIFASGVKKSPPITLSPFNSAALIVEEPPKALYDDNVGAEEDYEDEEESSFSNFIQKPFEAFLPSFLTNKKPKPTKVQVAGSLPITVTDQSGQKLQVGRRPQASSPSDSRFPILGSLFNRKSPQPPQPRRPLRPDVPAQPSVGNTFMPVGPSRQRSSPVSIPLPGSVQDLPAPLRVTRDVRSNILRYIEQTPLPVRKALLKQDISQDEQLRRVERRLASEPTNCSWTIETEKNLYLLVTFHNLSAPFTVDCEGAYIEVERERNGFEARWCGNRVTQGGSRPHVIFARNEVRITVYDDGQEGKELPTGFNADVEVMDLFDAGEVSSLRKTNGYSNVRKLAGKSLIK